MANDCLNLLEIETTPKRALFILRGESELERLRHGSGSPSPISGLIADLRAGGDFGYPRFTLTTRALRIDFESRWRPPVDSVADFAAVHPELTVSLSYWEPCMGLFGRVRWLAGVISSDDEYDSATDALRAFRSSRWRPDRILALNSALMRLEWELDLAMERDATADTTPEAA